MTASTDGVLIPDWDLADRLNKALKVAGMSVQEMADYLGVHRNTVSAWINDRTPPDTRTVRLWAMRTGVPFEWLRDGTPPQGPPSPPDPGGQVRDKKRKPPRISKTGQGNTSPVVEWITPYLPEQVA